MDVKTISEIGSGWNMTVTSSSGHPNYTYDGTENQTSGSNSTQTEEFEKYINPLSLNYIGIPFIVMYSLIFACCFFGNLLVMVVILRHHKMRTVTNFFLCNLALADFCVGVFCVIPNLMHSLTLKWMLGKILCKCFYFIQAMSYTASVIILIVISFERYVAIIYPIRSKQVTSLFLLRTVIIGVWAIAAVSGIPFLVIYDTFDVKGDTYCAPINGGINYKAYSLANIILLYIVPLILMTCMYTRISVVLWSSSGGGKIGEKIAKKKPSGKGNPAIRIDPPDEQHSISKVKLADENEFNENAEDSQSMLMGNGKSDSVGDRRLRFKSQNNFTADSKASLDNLPADYEDDWPGNKKKRAGVVEMSNMTRPSQFNNSASKCDGKMVVPLSCRDSGQRGSIPSHNRRQGNALVARRKVIRLLVSVIISFALCVLPYHVRMMWSAFFTPEISFVQKLIPPITFLCYYMNSGLNPILYAFLSENFRRSLKEVITCSQRTSKRGAVRTMTYGSRTTNYTLNSTCA